MAAETKTPSSNTSFDDIPALFLSPQMDIIELGQRQWKRPPYSKKEYNNPSQKQRKQIKANESYKTACDMMDDGLAEPIFSWASAEGSYDAKYWYNLIQVRKKKVVLTQKMNINHELAAFYDAAANGKHKEAAEIFAFLCWDNKGVDTQDLKDFRSFVRCEKDKKTAKEIFNWINKEKNKKKLSVDHPGEMKAEMQCEAEVTTLGENMAESAPVHATEYKTAPDVEKHRLSSNNLEELRHRARQFFEEGVKLFEGKFFTEAAEKFRFYLDFFALMPKPSPLDMLRSGITREEKFHFYATCCLAVCFMKNKAIDKANNYFEGVRKTAERNRGLGEDLIKLIVCNLEFSDIAKIKADFIFLFEKYLKNNEKFVDTLDDAALAKVFLIFYFYGLYFDKNKQFFDFSLKIWRLIKVVKMKEEVLSFILQMKNEAIKKNCFVGNLYALMSSEVLCLEGVQEVGAARKENFLAALGYYRESARAFYEIAKLTSGNSVEELGKQLSRLEQAIIYSTELDITDINKLSVFEISDARGLFVATYGRIFQELRPSRNCNAIIRWVTRYLNDVSRFNLMKDNQAQVEQINKLIGEILAADVFSRHLVEKGRFFIQISQLRKIFPLIPTAQGDFLPSQPKTESKTPKSATQGQSDPSSFPKAAPPSGYVPFHQRARTAFTGHQVGGNSAYHHNRRPKGQFQGYSSSSPGQFQRPASAPGFTPATPNMPAAPTGVPVGGRSAPYPARETKRRFESGAATASGYASFSREHRRDFARNTPPPTASPTTASEVPMLNPEMKK